jgi:hypothetical protein
MLERRGLRWTTSRARAWRVSWTSPRDRRGLGEQVSGADRAIVRTERHMHALERRTDSLGRSARTTSTYFAMLRDRTLLLTRAAVGALPVVQALAGATGALGGSLMGAGLGASAVGLAGGGALAAGIGSVVAVAKPAQKALEEAMKAQVAYTEAVRDHGRHSVQALATQQALDRAYAGQPGLRRATRELNALNREWRELTAPGRRQWFGLLGDVAGITRHAAPRMARNANAATGAVRRAGVSQARFLAGDEMQGTLETLTRSFVRELPSAERSLQNVEVTMARLARASLPFFEEGVEWIESTTGGWRRSSKDVKALRRQIGGYVDDLRSWGDLTGSAFKLAHDVLQGGRPAGRSMVEDLTETFDRWDDWIERNPGRIDRFFRDAATDTATIADALADGARGLHDMATELRPLIDPLARLVKLASDLSSALSPGAAATLLLGVRGLRQRAVRGGGPAAMPGVPATGGSASGGLLPLIMGGGAAGGAARITGGLTLRERGQRFMWQRQMAADAALWGGAGLTGNTRALRAASYGLPGAVAGSAARGARGVGRSGLPAVAIGGLQGAFGPGGANQGEGIIGTGAWGIRNAAQGVGAMFGLANPVLGGEERTNRGLSRAQQFVSQLPGGTAPTGAEARQAGRALAPELSRAEQAAANAAGNRNDYREALAYLKALRGQAQAYRDIAKEAGHARDVELNQRSREHAAGLLESFGKRSTSGPSMWVPRPRCRRRSRASTRRCAGCAAPARRSSERTRWHGQPNRPRPTRRSPTRSSG